MSDLYWLTDEQMGKLAPFFPKSHGKPRVDDWRVLSGIIFINRNGLRWRVAPEAYGPHKNELVHVMERSSFPPEINLEVGKQLRVRTREGTYKIVTIKDFSKDNIVIDENDPLAGKALTFKIELIEIL